MIPTLHLALVKPGEETAEIYRLIGETIYLPGEEEKATSRISCGAWDAPLQGMVVVVDTKLALMTSEEEFLNWATRKDNSYPYLSGDYILLQGRDVSEETGADWHLELTGKIIEERIWARAFRRVGQAPLLDVVKYTPSELAARLRPTNPETTDD